MPLYRWQEISPEQLRRRGRIRLAIAPGTLVTLLVVGLVSVSAFAVSLVLSKGAPPWVASLHLLATISIIWLAAAQWRALWQAHASRDNAIARADRLEHEVANHQYLEEAWPHREERYRTPLDQIQDYTLFLLDVQG